jgi:hypothetical protein
MMQSWIQHQRTLGVFIESILRPKTKWIQNEFNGLSKGVWVKKAQICQSGPLSTFWIIYEATFGVPIGLKTRHLHISNDIW